MLVSYNRSSVRFFSPDSVSGATYYMVFFSFYVTYLETYQEVAAGLVRSTLGADSVSGATYYMVFFSFYVTYLETYQEVAAGLVRSTLGGLNLLNHCTHKDTMLVHDGGAS